jgi:DNA-binding MarR family transcriptional regulator
MARDESSELLWRVAQECTASQLRRATRAITRLYDDAMRESGLEGTQLNVLVALALMGNPSIGRLSEKLGVDRTTMTRNLVPLQRNGWVESSASEDRRVRGVKLTARGRRTLERALPLWERTQAEVVAKLGKGKWSQLLTLLSSVEKLAT